MTTLDIRQLAEHGGVNPIAPVTVPEAVKFEDGADLNTAIGSIATIETSPATATHAIGDYIVWNGQLYKVTAAIAVGETLSTSTNVSATNIGSELNAGLMHGTTSTISVGARAGVDFSVTFPKAFNSVPDIMLQSLINDNAGLLVLKVKTRTVNGFTGRVYNDDGATVNIVIMWLAIAI